MRQYRNPEGQHVGSKIQECANTPGKIIFPFGKTKHTLFPVDSISQKICFYNRFSFLILGFQLQFKSARTGRNRHKTKTFANDLLNFHNIYGSKEPGAIDIGFR